MSAFRGAIAIPDIKRGTTSVQRVMRGSQLVWARSANADNFERDDANTLGPNWIQSTQDGLVYTGILSGTSMSLFSAYQSSAAVNCRNRWAPSVALIDNMYGQVTIAAKNQNEDLVTSVGIRHNIVAAGPGATGSYSSGVLGYAVNGALAIVSMINNAFAFRTPFVSTYEPGDRIRIEAVGQRYSLKRNGVEVTSWLDNSGASGAPLVPIGSAYRSWGYSTAAISNSFSYRRFSPSIADWEGGVLL